MRLKHQILSGVLILFLVVALIPPVSAFDDEQTRHIELTDKPGSDADSFVTEAGIGYSTSLVTITDPNMDIYAYLFFEDIKINYWHYLINATLRLRTASSMPFDADSSVTIYGVDDYLFFGSGTKGYGPFGAPSEIMNAPLTTTHVNLNTSQFYGSQWWEIDVTNIVQELKSNPHWDGPGYVRADPGDNMGFIILSSGGHDTRYFYDLKAGNGFEAQLNLHWTSTPCPPWEYPDAVFEESYGNYSIWNHTTIGQVSLNFFFNDVGVYYQNTTDIAYRKQAFFFNEAGYPYGRTQQRIVHVDDWIVITTNPQPGQVNITWSDDYFESNRYYSLPNDNWVELDNWAGREPCLWVDDDGLIHMTYATPSVWEAGVYNIIYFTFNILEDGTIVYSDTFENVTMMGTTNRSPDMYVQRNGTIHITYHRDKVYYKKRWPNGTWTSEVQVSPHDIDDFRGALIVASETKGDALIAWVKTGQLWWNYVFSNMTVKGAINTGDGAYRPSMVSHRDDDVAHIAYSHLNVQPGQIRYSYISIDSSSSWSAPQGVSPAGEKHFFASLGIDEFNDTIHILWANEWNVKIAVNSFQIGDAPIPSKKTISSFGNYRVAVEPYPESDIYTVWIITDLNGAIVQDDLESLEDAQDWIDLFDTDPEDPDPGGEWGTTGPFTRFKMRLYFLILGFGCVFGPVLFFSWRRPTAYYLMVGAIIMIMGLGLLMAIGDI